MAKFTKKPVQNYEKVTLDKKTVFFNNIIGGIGWALGATVGGAILIAVLTFAVHKVNLIPIIGDGVAQIMQYVNEKTPSK